MYPDYLTTGHAANWAFLPLYPMLGRTVSSLLGCDIYTAFYLITNVAFLCAVLLWVRFLKFFNFSQATQSFAVVFLCFLPYSTYYLAPYTESLFLALTLGAFINAYLGRYLLAAICAMGMTATKNVGIMFVFPLVLLFIEQHGWKALFNLKELRTYRLYLAVMLVPLPMFIFQHYLFAHVGNALAFKDIQLAWGRTLDNPLEHVVNAFVIGGYKAYFAVMFILGLLLTGVLYLKRRFAEATYLLICSLIPVSTGVNAFARYLFGTLPCLLAIIYLLDRRPLLRQIALAIGAILCLYFVVAWSHGKFFTV